MNDEEELDDMERRLRDKKETKAGDSVIKGMDIIEG